MPDDIGGVFDGGGSVRWEVTTSEDDGTIVDVKGNRYKVVEEYHNGDKGRRNRGVDKDHAKDFRVIMKVPTNPEQRRRFLAQFQVPERDGHIEVRLPIDKVDHQLQVRWSDPGGRE